MSQYNIYILDCFTGEWVVLSQGFCFYLLQVMLCQNPLNNFSEIIPAEFVGLLFCFWGACEYFQLMNLISLFIYWKQQSASSTSHGIMYFSYMSPVTLKT